MENTMENFCSPNKSHKFSPICFFATCCSDKILVHTKRFVAATCLRNVMLQLVARPVHKSDLLPRRVTATCRLVCSDLNTLLPKNGSNLPPSYIWPMSCATLTGSPSPSPSSSSSSSSSSNSCVFSSFFSYSTGPLSTTTSFWPSSSLTGFGDWVSWK